MDYLSWHPWYDIHDTFEDLPGQAHQLHEHAHFAKGQFIGSTALVKQVVGAIQHHMESLFNGPNDGECPKLNTEDEWIPAEDEDMALTLTMAALFGMKPHPPPTHVTSASAKP